MIVTNIEDITYLRNKSIVTVGMFDGLHIGHQHILTRLMEESAARKLTPLVVTFNQHPRVALGLTDHNFHQLMTTEERLEALELFGVPQVVMVDFTPETAQITACQFTQQFFIDRLHVGALLLGYDNMFGNKKHNDFDQLPLLAKQQGFELLTDTAVQMNGTNVSSTTIRIALNNSDIELTNALLGRRFKLSGVVVHGRHVGRTIGFPTANIEAPDPFKATPGPGVYAVSVERGGITYIGMANVGPRPTFAVDIFALEVHLIDFDGDLYGETLTVHFHKRMRDIVKFNSVDELVRQLNEDRDSIRRLLS